jgi:nitric oxide reductase large subunit
MATVCDCLDCLVCGAGLDRHTNLSGSTANLDPRGYERRAGGMLRFSFWSLNIGLMAMCVLSLLPVGLLQTWASVEQGYWYARSAEFMQTPLMQNLRWMRVLGDTVFFLGAVALVVFIAGLKTGYSFQSTEPIAKEKK